MKTITIDIETIPCQDDILLDDIRSKVRHPGSIKKQETIDKWNKESRPQAEEDAILKTSFSGLQGEIICIGYAIDDNAPKAIYRNLNGNTEKALLVRFYETLSKHIGKLENPLWVGHNLSEFDLRFLFHRSVINNVKPAIPLPYNAKPWSHDVFDTLYETMGNNKAGGSLNAIAKAFGLGGKLDGMSGDQVWPEYQKGNIEKIAEYCIQDVIIAREIYKRLNFIDSVKND